MQNTRQNRRCDRLVKEELSDENQGALDQIQEQFDAAFAKYGETVDWYRLYFKDARKDAVQHAVWRHEEETGEDIEWDEVVRRCESAIR